MAPKTNPDAPKAEAPKRPASAYFVFMAEKRAENPDEKMGTKVGLMSSQTFRVLIDCLK